MKQIHIGNLRYDVTVSDVRGLLAMFGTVYSVDLHLEETPDKLHAYAFAEMEAQDADEAIAELNGTEFLGQTLKVEEAIPAH